MEPQTNTNKEGEHRPVEEATSHDRLVAAQLGVPLMKVLAWEPQEVKDMRAVFTAVSDWSDET